MKKQMKRALGLLLAATMFLTMTPVFVLSVAAETVSSTCGANGDNLTWSLDTQTGILTIDGEGAMADYNTYSFPAPWYEYADSIKTVQIGDKVTSIGDFAFYECSSLASITIPDSVTSIGRSAFRRCSSLASVTIGNGVTSIGNYTFYECSSLASITIPDSVTSIGIFAFYGCSSLASITIPDSVTSIGEYAISRTAYYNDDQNWEDGVLYIGNHLIEAEEDITGDYTVKAGTKTIADFAFYSCESLASITIPDSVTSIGDWAFAECSSLASITIPDSVTSIDDETFYHCESLTSVTIPDSVKSIGRSAFSGCSLTSVTIPDSVTSIGYEAFAGCSLTSITIPDSVTSIGSGAFSGCSLTSITVEKGNSVYHSAGNCLIETTSKTLIAGCQNSEIPADGSVTSIGDDAFRGCGSLTSVTIPDSMTSIGDGAFEYCSNLASITIPDSVTSIGYDAFADTAYYKNDQNWENGVLYIGNHLIKAKSDITGDYTVKAGTKTIAGSAFSYCQSLASITIPDSVKSIGKYAFYNCSSLASITIPDSVTSIGARAFEDCRNLVSVTIPDSVVSIGEYAFYGCSKLTDIYYLGTQSEWDAISKSGANIPETATVHFLGIANNNVTAHYADGHAFDEGVTLSAAVRDDVVLPADLAECENAVVMDITLQKEGKAVQPDSAVTVRVPVPQGMDAAICRVFRLEADGSVTDMQAKAVGEYLYFTTEHFSLYVIAEKASAAALGDVDGDTEITSTDARLVLQYYAKKIDGTKLDISVADVDNDTEITSTDARLILQYYAKKITEFPTKK